MTTLLVLIVVFLIFIFGSLFLALFAISRAGKSATDKVKKQTTTARLPPFNWKFIVLPVIILLLTVVMTAVLYGKLPADVAYHFTEASESDTWTTRGILLCWALLPQVVLVLLALGIIRVISRMGANVDLDETSANLLASIQLVMGNMIVLPQLVLSFTMLNTFVYNAYGTEFVPLWLVAVIIMAVGGIILGIFFTRAVRVVRKLTKEENKQDIS
jgi:uncharacterized membrane protein